MTQVFYIASAFAVVAAFLAVTRSNALHAVLYLVLSLFALAIDFLALGAPFIAALEIVVYAGAIVVVILFVMMMVAGATVATERERRWLPPRAWIMPSMLALALAALTIASLTTGGGDAIEATTVGPREVGAALFTTYLIGVELASVLLLAGLAGAYYLGARD
ncbi:MAG: NADH-quinone oxidoreductase subunit J [Acidobacteriota bacterium]|jgi:NADH-quinone oxidoreductase subunit J